MVASFINNIQVLLKEACFPPHRLALPGPATEARDTQEPVNSEVPHEDFRRKCSAGSKGAGGILNSNSPGTFHSLSSSSFSSICGQVPRVRELLRIRLVLGVMQEKKNAHQNIKVRKGIWEKAINDFLSHNRNFPSIIFPPSLNANPQDVFVFLEPSCFRRTQHHRVALPTKKSSESHSLRSLCDLHCQGKAVALAPTYPFPAST